MLKVNCEYASRRGRNRVGDVGMIIGSGDGTGVGDASHLRDKGIEATTKLSESPNAKVIVIGSGKDGLPIILGNQ